MGAPNLSEWKISGNVLSVYGYTNFRVYLRDFYQFRKEGTRGYSYRAFSKAAGLTSPNYLKLVIDGQRNISQQMIDKFIKALQLKPSMAAYFRALVNMNQAKDDQEKQSHLEEMQKLIPNSQRNLLELDGLKYLEHWLFPVIREMSLLPDFTDDPYWLARRIRKSVSISEITRALNFLKAEGYIEKNQDGTWQASADMVISSDEVRSLAIRNYHRTQAELAKEMIDILAVEEREFGALTLTLPEHALDELKFRLKAFRQDIHQWAVQTIAEQASDTVVQLNFQMFPHTKKGATDS